MNYDRRKKKVSIIVPVYNSEQTLERCIVSILRQSYEDFELILVNDGSSDRSQIIIDQYKEVDSRIKDIKIDNGGVSYARNIGLKHVTGEYVGFVDADDYVHENMLLRLLEGIQTKNTDVAVCRYESNEQLLEDTMQPPIILSAEEILSEMMLPQKKVAAFVWNRLIKVELLKRENIQFREDVKACEDTLFNYMVLKNCKHIAFVDSALYLYSINFNSAMFKKCFNADKLTANIAFEYMLEDTTNDKKKEYIEVACMLYNLILFSQVLRYRYKLNPKEKSMLKQYLNLNPVKFMTSDVSLKYKISYPFFSIL